MHSYSGKILHVDMGGEKTFTETLSENVARKFLGGRGLAAKLLYEGTEKGIDPLGPDNLIVFAVGPLADTPVPGASRYVVVAKSPQTGGFGEAYCGGSFGMQMRRTGFDAITISGQAREPLYLSVIDGEAEFHDADGIWGQEVIESNKAVLDEIGVKGTLAACIGPAGENTVRFACVLSEVNRAAGRCGMGAVMGSKNLKAIALHGDRKVEYADEEALKKFATTVRKKAAGTSWAKSITKYGTSVNMTSLSETGELPTKNYRERSFADVEQMNEERVLELITGAATCPGCAIRCDQEMRVSDGKWAGVVPEYGGVEYETMASMGSNCLNPDIESVAWLNQRCNALGLDTISMGATLSMLMDATEQGIVSDPEMRLKWGDADGMARLIELTGRREGVGDEIAEGSARLAKKLGMPELSCNVKGLEAGMHEPRVKKVLGLGFATANRGATHMEVWFDPCFEEANAAPELGITKPVGATEYTDKGHITAIVEDFISWLNSLITCAFNTPGTGKDRVNQDLVNALSAATGWDYSIDEALETGRRAFNLCRMFNVREDWGREQDVIPHVFTQPTTTGDNPNDVIAPADFKALLDEYYRHRGWDEDGIPTEETMKNLGLDVIM